LIVKVNTAALFLNVVAGVSLIPPFGAWGAVAANVLTQVVAIALLVLNEPLAMQFRSRAYARLLRSFVLGCASAVVALLAGGVVDWFFGFLAPLAACIVGSGIYVAGIRHLQAGLTHEERDLLANAFGARARPYLGGLLRPITTPIAES
jgi:O-antigen/teichoic acid export membrane protein